MSIDLSSYYSYLNSLSINTKSTATQSITDSLTTNNTESSTNSDFELALLSMINNSSSAYDKVAEANTETASNSTASSQTSQTVDDATELYNQLSEILNSYNCATSIPSSISESLFSMLNTDSSSASTSKDQSNINLTDIVDNISTK